MITRRQLITFLASLPVMGSALKASTKSFGTKHVTLCLRDTAARCPELYRVPVPGGYVQRVSAYLVRNIKADLTVRFTQRDSNGSFCGSWDAKIPATTNPCTVIQQCGNNRPLWEGDTLSCDIVSSDESQHPDGVALFTIEWE